MNINLNTHQLAFLGLNYQTREIVKLAASRKARNPHLPAEARATFYFFWFLPHFQRSAEACLLHTDQTHPSVEQYMSLYVWRDDMPMHIDQDVLVLLRNQYPQLPAACPGRWNIPAGSYWVTRPQ